MKIAYPVAAGVLLLALAGCANGDELSGMGAPAATSGATDGIAVVDPVPVVQPAPTPTQAPTAAPGFGRAFAYGTGLTVKVRAPHPYSPSTFVHPGAGTAMRLRITLTNATGSSFNPRHLKVQIVSGGVAAEQIFDSPRHVVARPEERIPDGAASSFSVGFWVPEPADLTLQFVAGEQYEPVIVAD